MGNPATLSQFLRIGQSAFPADNYGLIFWNHGSGSVGGFGYDECYPDDRFLSLREIGEALESSRLSDNKKYAFIGFDACLMATLETASVLSPYADYMIASQELEPGGGWDYRRVIPLWHPIPPLPTPFMKTWSVPTLQLIREMIKMIKINSSSKISLSPSPGSMPFLR